MVNGFVLAVTVGAATFCVGLRLGYLYALSSTKLSAAPGHQQNGKQVVKPAAEPEETDSRDSAVHSSTHLDKHHASSDSLQQAGEGVEYKMVLAVRMDLNLVSCCNPASVMGQLSGQHFGMTLGVANLQGEGKCAMLCSTAALGAYKKAYKRKSPDRNGASKVCVRVESMEEFVALNHKAKDANVQTHVVNDSRPAEGAQEPHVVAVMALGPATSGVLGEITGHLQRLI